MKHVLVTAGGTREPIDDVRAVTNSSSGRFGAALALAAHEQGFRVTFVAAHDAIRAGIAPPGARVVPFGTTEELDAALTRCFADDPPDVVFMAAAVADYRPVPTDGKIASDRDELVIRMGRTPKILATLRRRLPTATLVGFKLLSGVTPEELATVGVAQCRRDALDFTVANDLAELGGDAHPVTLCRPDGTLRRIAGERSVVAARLISAIVGVATPGPFEAHAVRDDVQRAASVALIDVTRCAILLGRRRVPPSLNDWAFPGGRLEAGESAWEAALRELHEETGIQADGREVWRMRVTVGSEDRAWEITNFGVLARSCPEPVETAELAGKWIEWSALGSLGPSVTVGTQAVLAHFSKWLER